MQDRSRRVGDQRSPVVHELLDILCGGNGHPTLPSCADFEIVLTEREETMR